MSVNLGNEAIAAARQLHQAPNSDLFTAVREGLLEAWRREMHKMLDGSGSHENIQHSAGYVKALRDVFMALDSAATGKPINQVEKPGARHATR
jgi:hypothetical protein